MKLFLKISCENDYITIQDDLITFNEWCDLIGLSLNIVNVLLLGIPFSKSETQIIYDCHSSSVLINRLETLKDIVQQILLIIVTLS